MLPTLDKYLSILINTIYIFVQTCESDRFQLTNLSIVTILIFFISVLIFILCLITFNTLKVPKSLKLGKTLWSLKTFNSFCKIQRGYIKYPQVGVCTALHPLEALGAICSLLLPSSGGDQEFLGFIGFLGLWPHHSHLCLCLHITFSEGLMCMRMITCRAHPGNPQSSTQDA